MFGKKKNSNSSNNSNFKNDIKGKIGNFKISE